MIKPRLRKPTVDWPPNTAVKGRIDSGTGHSGPRTTAPGLGKTA